MSSQVEKCGFTASIANGESVTPCHKKRGHDGPHEGTCLGSRCTWHSDERHWDEEEAWKTGKDRSENYKEQP